MNGSEIVLHQRANFIAPVVDVPGALARYQAMKDFIAKVLRPGVDYGEIPGTNKPTLLKPGAEKLSTFFGLSPRFEIAEKVLDWTGADHGGEAFFYFHYRCRLYYGDVVVAESEGSASSWEKKYRYRLSEVVCPDCGKAAIKRSKFPPRGRPNDKPGWYCHDRAGGCGANFSADDKRIVDQERGQVKNPDVADVVNTLQKMAQKRAYVAAVLLAVNGSEYFTQDLEDFNYIEGEYTIEPASSNTSNKPAAPAAVQAAAETNATVTEMPEMDDPFAGMMDQPETAALNDALAPAAPKQQPAPAASMSLETAENVKGDDDIRYGDLDNKTLAGKSNGINKALRRTDLTDAEREEYKFKLAAIGVILKHRNGG